MGLFAFFAQSLGVVVFHSASRNLAAAEGHPLVEHGAPTVHEIDADFLTAQVEVGARIARGKLEPTAKTVSVRREELMVREEDSLANLAECDARRKDGARGDGHTVRDAHDVVTHAARREIGCIGQRGGQEGVDDAFLLFC